MVPLDVRLVILEQCEIYLPLFCYSCSHRLSGSRTDLLAGCALTQSQVGDGVTGLLTLVSIYGYHLQYFVP